jgi:hypothetical protein
LPAVDILVIEVHDGFAELFDQVLGDEVFPALEGPWSKTGQLAVPL